MLPFHVPVIRTDDDNRRVPILNPVYDAQHEAVVCLVGSTGTGTFAKLPRSWPPEAVSHPRYHEKPVKRVHLGSPPFDCTKKRHRSQKTA